MVGDKALVLVDPVEVALTATQVEQVVRQADASAKAGDSLLAILLALGGSRNAPILKDLERGLIYSDPSVSRSVLVAVLILAAVPSEGQVGVNALAKQVGIHTSTLHRYLKTWVRIGLLEQDPVTQAYQRPQ